MSLYISGTRISSSTSSRIEISWEPWKRCLMIRRRESVTGKQIHGFGWIRKERIWEDHVKWEPSSQFAKNKREIFKFKLTVPEETYNELPEGKCGGIVI